MFSQVREDPLIELSVAEDLATRLGRPIRVLLVASGGDTVLSLCGSEHVAAVTALDGNPAQLHLLEAKEQAMLHLTPEEQTTFLGAFGTENDGPDDPEARREAWEKLCPHLQEPSRLHWQQRLPEVLYGLNRVGRFEEHFRLLAARLTEYLGHPPDETPSESVRQAGWQRAFKELWEREYLARQYSRAAVDFSMSREFDDHFDEVFTAANLRWPRGENYFLEQVFHDRFLPRADGVPPWLDPLTQQRIIQASGTEKIETRHGAFSDWVFDLTKTEKFDLIQTSNLSDWMPEPEMLRIFRRAKDSLTDGGAVLCRRLNGDHILATSLSRLFRVDEEECKLLKHRDRSFFYAECVLGRKG